MKFSSWTYNGEQVSLRFEKGNFVDLSDYWRSGSWTIVMGEWQSNFEVLLLQMNGSHDYKKRER